MEERGSSGATFFELSVAFLLGALLGAGAALMFAPASGVETRKKLAEVGEKAIESGKKLAEAGRQQVEKVVETAKTKAKEVKKPKKAEA